MNISVREKAVDAVIQNNRQWPDNRDYNGVGEQEVGPFTIHTVEFWSANREQVYHNFAVARGNDVIGAYYSLPEAVTRIDRGLGWRSLLVGQYTTVIGSVVILLFVIGLISKLIMGGVIDRELWVIVSAGVGYLFGAKPEIKPHPAQNRP